MKGAPATAGSKILKGYQPPYDATAVSKLEAAGAVLLGKLNCDEFAMGSSNENSAYGPVRNPVDTERVPGGSSGGSAAAGGGQHGCGLAGNRYRRLDSPASQFLRSGGRAADLWTCVALRIDCVCFFSGPCGAVCGQRARCGYAAGGDCRARSQGRDKLAGAGAGFCGPRATNRSKGCAWACPAEYFAEGLDAEVRANIEKGIAGLKAAGCTVKPVSLPHTRYAIPTYYLVATAEASANLARFDGGALRLSLTRFRGHWPACTTTRAKRALARRSSGAFCWGRMRSPPATTTPIIERRSRCGGCWPRSFLRVFADVDAIVTPTAPTAAFKLGEKTGDPLAMYLADIYTVTASLAGICGVTVPCGATAAGLPVGMQVLAAHLKEGTAFRVARAVEAAQI